MKHKFSIFRNEDGSTVVLTVLILVALTLTGISAITTSSIDIQIAANDKAYKTALHNADSGAFAIAKEISRTLREENEGAVTLGDISGSGEEKRHDGFTYLDSGTNDDDGTIGPTFARELCGFDSYYAEPNEIAKYDTDPDIRFTLNDNAINVDVQRVEEPELQKGGGIQFSSGYEGYGAGAASGGVDIIFNLNSFGSAPRNTQSNIYAVYRYVPGTPGGL